MVKLVTSHEATWRCGKLVSVPVGSASGALVKVHEQAADGVDDQGSSTASRVARYLVGPVLGVVPIASVPANAQSYELI